MESPLVNVLHANHFLSLPRKLILLYIIVATLKLSRAVQVQQEVLGTKVYY